MAPLLLPLNPPVKKQGVFRVKAYRPITAFSEGFMKFIEFFAKSRLLCAEIVGDVAVEAAQELGVQNPSILAAIRGFGAGAGGYAPMLPLLSVAVLPVPGLKTACAAAALTLDIVSLPVMAEMAVEEVAAARAMRTAPAPAVN